jgi:hypothetical protein
MPFKSYLERAGLLPEKNDLVQKGSRLGWEISFFIDSGLAHWKRDEKSNVNVYKS